MPIKGVRIRVWCEDGEQERFVRRLLESVFGIDRRAVDCIKAPKGVGAASSWVKSQYVQRVVPECRRVRNQHNLGFLIMIDGDNVGFRRRLVDMGADQRDAADRIALLVPTWSVETWVLWLSGDQGLTETTSFKNHLDQADFKECLVRAISAWDSIRSGESTAIPSLAAARIELARLPIT